MSIEGYWITSIGFSIKIYLKKILWMKSPIRSSSESVTNEQISYYKQYTQLYTYYVI